VSDNGESRQEKERTSTPKPLVRRFRPRHCCNNRQPSTEEHRPVGDNVKVSRMQSVAGEVVGRKVVAEEIEGCEDEGGYGRREG
jgi:hypothetical protein